MLIPFYLIFLFLILVPSSGKTTSKIKNIGSLPSKYLSKQSNSEKLFVNDAKRSIKSPYNPIVSAQDVTASSQASMRTVNLVNLLFYGTLGSVMPYLPLFYRILGVSDENIGFLGALTPAVTFIVSPLWSAIADSTGLHKPIMMLTFLGSILSRFLLIRANNNVLMLGAIVIVSAILNAPVKPLLDEAIMSMLTDKSSYGRSRLFGQVGFGVGSFIVDKFVRGNIRSMFYIHLLLSFPTLILMYFFDPKKPKSKSDESRNKVEIINALKHTLSNLNVSIFFLVVFIVGISSGIVENFAYVKLSEISPDAKNAFGTLRLASSFTGGPMFWLSGSIIKRIGVENVLTLSLCTYIVRFLIYGTVGNVWYALPAEMLRGFTFALFWSASTYYVYQIAPKQLTATMLGILNGIYGGIGQSLGSLIGGALSRRFGLKNAFYSCAAVDFIILLVFLIYRLNRL